MNNYSFPGIETSLGGTYQLAKLFDTYTWAYLGRDLLTFMSIIGIRGKNHLNYLAYILFYFSTITVCVYFF